MPVSKKSTKKPKEAHRPRVRLMHLEPWDGWVCYVDGKCVGYDNGNPDASSLLETLAAKGIIQFDSGTMKEEQLVDDYPPEVLEEDLP